MELIFIIFLAIAIMPILFGLYKKRIDRETFVYIITGKIMQNDSSIAFLLNVASILLSAIPLISFALWVAAFYFIIRNRKEELTYDFEEPNISQISDATAGVSSEAASVNFEEPSISQISGATADVNSEAVSVNNETDLNGVSDKVDVNEADFGSTSALSVAGKGGYEYKCVAAPARLMVKHKKDYDSCIRSYADIVEKESVGGWKFFLIQPIPILKKPGLIARILGVKEQVVSLNMIIFQKAAL